MGIVSDRQETASGRRIGQARWMMLRIGQQVLQENRASGERYWEAGRAQVRQRHAGQKLAWPSGQFRAADRATARWKQAARSAKNRLALGPHIRASFGHQLQFRRDIHLMDRAGPVRGLRISPERPHDGACLLYTSPSPRDGLLSRMPSSA